MADQGQRTEKPTKRKIDKSRREGQFPASRELLAALQFLTFVVLLITGGGAFLERARDMVRYFLVGRLSSYGDASRRGADLRRVARHRYSRPYSGWGAASPRWRSPRNSGARGWDSRCTIWRPIPSASILCKSFATFHARTRPRFSKLCSFCRCWRWRSTKSPAQIWPPMPAWRARASSRPCA